ncbi:MAG TPA: secretin N-terminal domain-containing protein, partial [Caulobacteraceae bacterium]
MIAAFPQWRSPARWLAAVWLLLCLGAAGRALADITVPSPPPAVLTEVAVKDVSPGETDVTLTFAPKAPTFSVILNDSAHPAIGFALSSRGPAARGPSTYHGLLQQIEFQQNETILVLKFAAAAQLHLKATTVNDHTISLTITSAHQAVASASGEAGSGALPKAMDRPPGEDGFELVPLKYADVSEVVGLLTEGQTVKSNDSFEPHEPAFGSASMNGSANYTPPPPNPDSLNQPLAQSVDDSIGIDRRLNAIILKGSPERIARLKAKIAEIDVPVESVLLETQFVELDETGAKNVGLNFDNTAGQIGVANFTSGSYSAPGLSGNPLHGVVSASLQAALYAQVTQGHGRIVSKPRIAAQSGGDAKIITGDALPILTSITLSGVNGVSQQVQYVNVGVTLQIAPRVSSDGFVTSHVFCVVSSVSGYSQGYPTISQREAETSATVHDGETFVIGGLTQDSNLITRSKVPGLGDVPGLGQIFHLNNQTRSKTELYIVVTPHIVHRG